MNTLTIPVGIMASISFYVGFYHFLIFLRRKQHREDLTFALLCFATCLYDIFCVGLYNVSNSTSGVQWQRAQFIALALFSMAFLWFMADYTHQKSKRVIYVFTAFFLVAIFIQLIDRTGFTWEISHTSLKQIMLPLGLEITYHEVAFGVFTTIQSFTGLAAATYIMACGIVYYKNGNKREASPLLLAIGIMYIAALSDTAVGNGWYKFVYTIEYGYMAMILLMTFSLSNTVVDAAMAKESLRKSEERFRALVETTNDWVWETTPDGSYSYSSPKVHELLGYEPEEIIGKTPFDLMPPEEADRIRGIFNEIVTHHRFLTGLENINQHKDGRLVVLETSGAPFFDNSGNLMGYRGIDRDITLRKRAEEALRESRNLLQTVLDTIPARIFWKDLDLTFLGCNQPFALDAGVNNPDEMIGKDDYQMGWRVQAELYRNDDRHVLESGESKLNFEEPQTSPDGTLRWLQTSKTPLRNADGEIWGLLGTYDDITEKKRVEQALIESEEKYRSIVENSLSGIFTVDDAYHFIYANDELSRILQYPKEELIGLDFRKVLSEESLTLVTDRYTRRMGGEQVPPRYEISVVRRDGNNRDVEMTIAVVKDASGKSRIIGQLVDITERKRAEEERERLISELENKNAELERFTYTVSHDLKSPLVTIRGFLGFLEKNALTGNLQQMNTDIARIRNATNKMQQLLNDVLELSRIGRVVNTAERVPFEPVIKEALELVRGRLEALGVQIDIMPGLPTIFGDRARLVEVVQNLVDNAAKFMGQQIEPRIEIGCTGEQNGCAVFYVKDNGIGIEPQYHDRIFGLFNKLNAETEGTGVGLALTKRIIEVHAGKIWVESDGAHHGATFYFTLPVGSGKDYEKIAKP